MMEREHKQASNSLDTDLVTDIIRVVSLSDGFFRHQQIGEADLTTEKDILRVAGIQAGSFPVEIRKVFVRGAAGIF